MPAGRQVKACVIALLQQKAVPLAVPGFQVWAVGFGFSARGFLVAAAVAKTHHPRRWDTAYGKALAVTCRRRHHSAKGCQHDDILSTFRLLVCSSICSCRGCTQTYVADMCTNTNTRARTTVRIRLIYAFPQFFHLLTILRADWEHLIGIEK